MYTDQLLNLILKQSKSTKEELIKAKGWQPWTSDKFWVNIKTVKDHSRGDYTKYKFTLDDAVSYEAGKRIFPEKFSMLNRIVPAGSVSAKKLNRVLASMEAQAMVDGSHQVCP